MGSQGSSMDTGATAGVRVRLFAGLRERAGWAERTLPLPHEGSPPTPAALWRQLALGEGPAAGSGDIPATIRVAINHAFAAPDAPLHPGDEVAFLPPITGG